MKPPIKQYKEVEQAQLTAEIIERGIKDGQTIHYVYPVPVDNAATIKKVLKFNYEIYLLNEYEEV